MNTLIQKSTLAVNGSISGRGLAHRKMTPKQRLGLAADVATGTRPYVPSLAQTAATFGVNVARLRQELKEREVASHDAIREMLVTQFVILWDDLSEAERVKSLGLIGPAPVWDVLAKIVA